MKIKELAIAAYTDTETIRFYEKKGLMPHPPRLANGYRDYQAVHQERLLFIRHCRSLDMPLADIHSLLDMTQANAYTHLHAESLVSNHIDRVQLKITSLQRLLGQLQSLRTSCRNASPDQACGVLQVLVEAPHGEACACHSPLATGGPSLTCKP